MIITARYKIAAKGRAGCSCAGGSEDHYYTARYEIAGRDAAGGSSGTSESKLVCGVCMSVVDVGDRRSGRVGREFESDSAILNLVTSSLAPAPSLLLAAPLTALTSPVPLLHSIE